MTHQLIKIEQAHIGDHASMNPFASPNPAHRGITSRVRILVIDGMSRTFTVARLQDDDSEAVVVPAGSLKE